MAISINTTNSISKVFCNQDLLDEIASKLTTLQVSTLRTSCKDVDDIIKNTSPDLKFEASSLKQNKARHELYKNVEFKKFLDQTFLEKNKIYDSENHPDIILKLLEKIKTSTDNDLKKTKFQDWLSAYLKGCDSVDLSHYQKITDEDLLVIAKLYPDLQSLDLSGGKQITDASIQVLGGFKNLKSLKLNGCCQITNLNPLSELESLNTLKLLSCYQITDASIKVLGGFKNLKSLTLFHCNQITDECVNNLKDQLPNLTIKR